MKFLVTGSAGHLGEALMRTLRADDHRICGIDVLGSPFTTAIGSINDRDLIRQQMAGCDAVLHTATLHKPHIVTHSMQAFIDTNITGTLILLEEAIRAEVQTFVFTSTTSVFGMALRPAAGQPAVWVTEELTPIPKNIYGVTKIAAEGLCQLFHKKYGLDCLVLRTSRFFPEDDDNASVRNAYTNDNIKANEYLNRRVELEDVVQAHLCALDKAAVIGFDRFIISATTPFLNEDMDKLREDAIQRIERRVPGYRAVYEKLGWQMVPDIDRVYVNDKARRLLGWQPQYDFQHVVNCLRQGRDPRSRLAIEVGSKGYHSQVFNEGPYPVE